MGGSQPSAKDKFESFQHPRLGNIRVIQRENTENVFIEYDVPVRNDHEIEQWQRGKQLIQNSETKEVLFLPLSHTFERSGMCGSSGTLKLVFEEYLFLLQSEIQNRAQINKPFLETEMWYLLYNIVRAGKEYEKHDRKIGDVQPYNIVINEDGQTKIISVDSWPGQETNFDRIVANRSYKAFLGKLGSDLAPEECVEQFLKKGEYPPNVNRNVAEAFSVGMTLLESASLKDCGELYYKTGDFGVNQDELRRTIEFIRGVYSPYLVNSIESLLSIDPRARPSCGEIHAVFAPYQPDILNLDEFTFDPNSSEKCLQTFQKFNPKNKSSQWSFNKLIGRQEYGGPTGVLVRSNYGPVVSQGLPVLNQTIPQQVVYTSSVPIKQPAQYAPHYPSQYR